MNTIIQLSGFGDTLLGYLLPFLFVLTIVVFVHELGHFLVARWCGVGIKAFSIGFGPEIAGFNDRYGTRWKLSWIPLGGYVKFIDDDNVAINAYRVYEHRVFGEVSGVKGEAFRILVEFVVEPDVPVQRATKLVVRRD